MLLASFNRLLLARGYGELSVRELVACADVGRSTFYEHFETKDDLLEHSLAPILAVIAGAVATPVPSSALGDVFTHLLAHRELTRALLQGATRPIVIRALATDLERHLTAFARRSAVPPIAALSFLALSLAHAQLGVVDAWLDDDGRSDVHTASHVLHATTRGGVAALFGPGGLVAGAGARG